MVYTHIHMYIRVINALGAMPLSAKERRVFGPTCDLTVNRIHRYCNDNTQETAMVGRSNVFVEIMSVVDDFERAKVRRRVAWACYLFHRIVCGGVMPSIPLGCEY